MREMMFHLGSDVVYTPSDSADKEYAGKAEVCGINMRGEEEIYLLLLKESKERVTAYYEELSVEGVAKPRAARTSTRTPKMTAAALKSKSAEPETTVNQVVSIKTARNSQ